MKCLFRPAKPPLFDMGDGYTDMTTLTSYLCRRYTDITGGCSVILCASLRLPRARKAFSLTLVPSTSMPLADTYFTPLHGCDCQGKSYDITIIASRPCADVTAPGPKTADATVRAVTVGKDCITELLTTTTPMSIPCVWADSIAPGVTRGRTGWLRGYCYSMAPLWTPVTPRLHPIVHVIAKMDMWIRCICYCKWSVVDPS